MLYILADVGQLAALSSRPLPEGLDVDSLDADHSADLVRGQLTGVENPVQRPIVTPSCLARAGTPSHSSPVVFVTRGS